MKQIVATILLGVVTSLVAAVAIDRMRANRTTCNCNKTK